MLYPENIESKLGFDQIRNILKSYCLSSLGQTYVDKIKFSYEHSYVLKLLRQVNEFKTIIEQDLGFPSSNYIDINPLLDKIRPEGSFLEREEFHDLKLCLSTIYSCLDFIDKSSVEETPELHDLAEGIVFDKRIVNAIEKVIDQSGNIRDNASEELQRVRRELISEQSRIRKELDRILKLVKKEGYTDEDVGVTIRNGRMVIPVSAEYKRKLKGFIHDESATGQTVFMEPTEVLDINNNIKELEYRERREILRILTALTSLVRPNLNEIKKATIFLGIIDFIRAKAKFAISIEASLPKLDKKPGMDLKQAKHPLLYLSLKKQGKAIVPLDVYLYDKQRILVISGPNAGGKSVSLKTAGLIQYMVQCGLLPSVSDFSSMGIFQNIFIDIGDEQSIENDLSTYSSHLKNMKYFMKFSDKKSLILIDEFGTGTEPQVGGAMAEAILENLNNLKTFGVITTHYSNIKLFAGTEEGLVNGSMRYDLQHLEPMYELETGRPGSSFALEIAYKIGLPKDIIDKARVKAGTSQIDFDKLTRELEREKNSFSNKNKKIKETEQQLKSTLQEYEVLKKDLEEHKKDYINKAKLEARELLKEANRRIEETIRNIKESKADKTATVKLRNELKEYQEVAVGHLEPEVEKQVFPIESGEIKEGDYVKVRDTGAIGKVESLKGKDAELLIGSLKSKVKFNRLIKISRKEYKHAHGEESFAPSKGVDINKKYADFSPNLDIRGVRGEEALSIVDGLMDNAIMFGTAEIKIIHGKGDGILRTLIRNHLKSYKEVSSMEDEHADRGGSGVTIVKLRF
jgi:DNA mismatch repair protein MutS2